jgi:hypothetical protein
MELPWGYVLSDEEPNMSFFYPLEDLVVFKAPLFLEI